MLLFQKFLITMYSIIHFDIGLRERDFSNPLCGIRTRKQLERKERQVKICNFFFSNVKFRIILMREINYSYFFLF